jgi:PAS domain S-box-containing protein
MALKRTEPYSKAFKISVIYCVFATLWIFFSDRLLTTLASNVDSLIYLQTAKGWLFVLLTAILLFSLVFRALSNQQAHEIARRSSEQIYHSLVSCSPVALMGIDLDGKVMVWNPSAEKIFGWKEDEVIGEFLPILPEEHMDEFFSFRDKVVSGETLSGIEAIRQKKDGTKIDVCLSTAPIRDQRGEITGIMAALEDVTDAKATKQALVESEAKFRDMFHKHAAVKFLIDAQSGKIVDANEAASAFYGWSVDQLKKMRIEEINILSPEEILSEMENAATQKRIHFEFKHRLADGSQRDVAVFSSAIKILGKDYLHSIVQDISEHKKLEVQFRQAQKMETVGRLAGGVAHDINNMLSVIMGYASLGMLRLEETDSMYEIFREINNAGKRSAEITKKLLAFARNQTISPKVLNLNDSLQGMLSMLQRLLGEDINLVWKPKANLDPVKIDPSQLDQILMNLCVNARDAIEDVGKLTIETDRVSFDKDYCTDHVGFIPGDFVLLAVSDNGCGMNAETVDKIFEPFFSTKGVGEGTGLGLATVYGIVKQNNGFINVYSEPGRGTTFKIYLPQHQAGKSQVTEALVVNQPLTGNGETILLVEDDLSLRNVTKTMLMDINYQVLTAATPAEALRIIEDKQAEIDLLLTDVVMPEMNGKELAESVLEKNSEIKVVYMSGYTANVISHHGVLDEGVNFIQKPMPLDELAKKLGEVLGAT